MVSVTPKQLLDRSMVRDRPSEGIERIFQVYGTRWEPGRYEMSWQPTDDWTVFHLDVVHGGALCMLLDSAMGMATLTVLEDDETFATADLQVQFIRGAKAGLLTTVASVVRRMRQMSFCAAEVRAEYGAIVAKGSGTLAILKIR